MHDTDSHGLCAGFLNMSHFMSYKRYFPTPTACGFMILRIKRPKEGIQENGVTIRLMKVTERLKKPDKYQNYSYIFHPERHACWVILQYFGNGFFDPPLPEGRESQ